MLNAMTAPNVSATDLSGPSNDPSTLNIAPGVQLTDLQRKHVAVVLDLWQRGGTMAKLKENFAEDVMYEDHFAYCHNLEELGQSASSSLHRAERHSWPAHPHSHDHLRLQDTPLPGHFVHAQGDDDRLQAHGQGRRDPDRVQARPNIQGAAARIGQDHAPGHQVFSSAEEGKIVRLQDRPKEELGDNSIINVRPSGSVADGSELTISGDQAGTERHDCQDAPPTGG